MKGSLCRLAETSFLWRDTAMRIRERFNPRAPCGARPLHRGAGRCKSDFNPRAPCGARHDDGQNSRHKVDFNPRAPCGARLPSCAAVIIAPRFQPTRPLRGATGLPARRPCAEPISTHAPLAGRDTTFEQAVDKLTISTHAPLAGRDMATATQVVSTQSISTHAPLAGRDLLRAGG